MLNSYFVDPIKVPKSKPDPCPDSLFICNPVSLQIPVNWINTWVAPYVAEKKIKSSNTFSHSFMLWHMQKYLCPRCWAGPYAHQVKAQHEQVYGGNQESRYPQKQEGCADGINQCLLYKYTSTRLTCVAGSINLLFSQWIVAMISHFSSVARVIRLTLDLESPEWSGDSAFRVARVIRRL